MGKSYLTTLFISLVIISATANSDAGPLDTPARLRR